MNVTVNFGLLCVAVLADCKTGLWFLDAGVLESHFTWSSCCDSGGQS